MDLVDVPNSPDNNRWILTESNTHTHIVSLQFGGTIIRDSVRCRTICLSECNVTLSFWYELCPSIRAIPISSHQTSDMYCY